MGTDERAARSPMLDAAGAAGATTRALVAVVRLRRWSSSVRRDDADGARARSPRRRGGARVKSSAGGGRATSRGDERRGSPGQVESSEKRGATRGGQCASPRVGGVTETARGLLGWASQPAHHWRTHGRTARAQGERSGASASDPTAGTRWRAAFGYVRV